MGSSLVLLGTIRAPSTLTATVAVDLSGSVPDYEGEYGVRPSAEHQVLGCAGKRMAKDVDVEPIPFSMTSNASMGYTVAIG